MNNHTSDLSLSLSSRHFLGINQGEDLPIEFLAELYNNILEDEIKMEGEETFPNALKKGELKRKSVPNRLGSRSYFLFFFFRVPWDGNKASLRNW